MSNLVSKLRLGKAYQQINSMDHLTSFLLLIIERYSLVAIFVFMVLGCALIPIPSEVVMPFAGFLVSRGLVNFWVVVLIGSLGSLVGSLLSYWLGYKLGDKSLDKFIAKWGRYLFIHKGEYLRVKRWFAKHGQAAAFYSRLLPVVRTYISLPVGIARADIKIFSLLTFLGSFIWNVALTYIGFALGENWQLILSYLTEFKLVFIGVAVVGLFVFWKLKRSKLRR